jgi:four helix bundle protein
MSPLRSFTELLAWQKARVVRKSASKLSKRFPAEEKFRLADQIIRSSRSTCANIAEGFGRFYESENARFCRMARGSLTETMDHLTAAYDEQYITKEELKEHWGQAQEAARVLNGYISYLKRFEPGSSSNSLNEPMEHYGSEDDLFGDSSDIIDEV